MPLRAEWHRQHRVTHGHIVQASVFSINNGRYRAAAMLDERTHSSIYVQCPDVETARVRADQLVQRAHPHDCVTHQCGEWAVEHVAVSQGHLSQRPSV